MLDLLWNKYWVNTLSSSPLLGTKDLRTGQIADIGEHVHQSSLHLLQSCAAFGCFRLCCAAKQQLQHACFHHLADCT